MLHRLLLLLLLFSSTAVFAQTRTVTGRVYAAKDNTPLPGASVVVKGTTNGTVSDPNGNFKLQVNDPAATTLYIRFIGMEQQEVPISATPLNIGLRSSGKDLNEVEIIVAYGTAKKGSYTGAVAQIKGTELENRQVSNVTKALQGLAAGVQSTSTSGQPGSDATIRIRGIGSINASADPLYVVDGVPYGGSLNAINPSDIESVSVLKDAASSALYGSRAANGVIIITTKKGKKLGTTIDARVSQGFSKRAVKDYKKVNTDQYFEMYWEALRNGGLTNGSSPATAATQASSSLVRKLGINPYGTAFPQPVGTNGKLVSGAKTLWNDDWDEGMQRTGQRTQADLNISGATEKSRYYISGGYLNDQGIYLASGFKRYNVRSNVELDAKKWLKIGLNISGAHSDQQAPPSEDSRTDNYVNYGRLMSDFYPIYQRDRTTGAYLLDANGNKMFDYGSYRPSAANTNSNLIGTSAIDKHNFTRDDLSARIFGEATIWKGLKFKTSYNADYTAKNQHEYTNPTYGFDAEVGGTVEKVATRTFSWTFNNILTYEQTFNEKHHLNLLAGQETYKFTNTFMDGIRSGFSLLGLDELSDASLIKDLQGYSDTYSLYSYLGRAEYDYLGKYFLSGSVRSDRSSRFAPDRAWGTFWSIGGSWKATEEDFLKSSSWLNLLTLRASYGAQGNDNLGDDSYYNYLSLLNVNSNLGEGGTYRRVLYNKNLKWETNLNLNVGVDYSMFNNRFGGTLEFFRRKSKDLLYYKPLPPSMGYGSIAQNIGALKNTGVEVTLHGVPVKTKDFSWVVDINATHYKNEVTELPQKEIISGTKKLMVGRSIYDFWIRDWAGVDEKTGLPLWYVTKADGTKGTTSTYSSASLYYNSTSLPDLYGGFTNTFNYKGFSFSFMVAYSLGGKVLDQDYLYLLGTGTSAGRPFSPEMLNHWTPENTRTDVPKLTTVQTNWTSVSSRFLYDASYARLKTVNLSYNLPKALMQRAHLNNVLVYLQGENLFTLYNHKGLDPEQSVGGTTYYRYPAIKSLSAGINLSF